MDERDDATRLVEAIAETRAAFTEALRRGDAAAAAAVYAQRATLLAPSAALISGRKPIEAFWDAGIAAGITDVELEPLELRRHDGVACEIGRYGLRLDPGDGGSVLERGKYVLVHERQSDGSWRRAVEMFNPKQGGSQCANA
jgi:uncharacterized protein (TIGR02246 family)